MSDGMTRYQRRRKKGWLKPKGCLSNGFGRGFGDCDAPGNSEDNNNAENAGA